MPTTLKETKEKESYAKDVKNENKDSSQKIIPKIEDLLKAGVHFGHKTSKWHPSMKQYIFAQRRDVHIIDLEKTIECLKEAIDFINNLIKKEGVILFIGIKKQAREIVKAAADETGMPYVVNKWIGGTLTNWHIIKKQIIKLKKAREEKEKGEWSKYTKRERLILRDNLKKLEEIYGGMSQMEKAPDVIFVIDCKENKTALREAEKKGIPVIALVDTNVNIKNISYPIPSNDDAVKSIKLMVEIVKKAIIKAKNNNEKNN